MIALSLTDYRPEAYDSLPEFYVARGNFSAIEDRVTEFGSIICKYRYQDIIGINLLHQHFPIPRSTILVRRSSHNGATMTPEPIREHTNRTTVPYLWMYWDLDEGCKWYPVEFAVMNECPVSELELLRYADPLLQELGEELVSKDLNRYLGIAGVHGRRGIRLEEDQTLLENTDEINKVLDLAVVGASTVDLTESTQTFWTFTMHDAQPANGE